MYTRSLQYIKPSGPTFFSPFLKEIKLYCSEKRKESILNYTFLLVITDGVVHDMSETLDALTELENEGISIVVVGVGNEDFSDMQVLDDVGNEDFKLKNANQTLDSEIVEYLEKRGERSRDLVQFVEFTTKKQQSTTMEQLTEEVLKEIPHQVVQYYQIKGYFDKKSFIKLASIQTEDLPDQELRKRQFLVNNMNYFNSQEDDSFEKEILRKNPSIMEVMNPLNSQNPKTIQNNYNITLNNYWKNGMNFKEIVQRKPNRVASSSHTLNQRYPYKMTPVNPDFRRFQSEKKLRAFRFDKRKMSHHFNIEPDAKALFNPSGSPPLNHNTLDRFNSPENYLNLAQKKGSFDNLAMQGHSNEGNNYYRFPNQNVNQK